MGDGLGHLKVIGRLRDYGGDNELRFSLNIDRTYLPPVVNALREIKDAWPIVEVHNCLHCCRRPGKMPSCRAVREL